MKNLMSIFFICFASVSYTEEIPIECVKEYIIELEIQHPIIVAKQAVKESGWVVSHYSINLNSSNNIFGFKINHELIKFNSWYDSVIYYKNWQERKYRGGDYYQFLTDVGYCHNCPEYNDDLKRIRVD